MTSRGSSTRSRPAARGYTTNTQTPTAAAVMYSAPRITAAINAAAATASNNKPTTERRVSILYSRNEETLLDASGMKRSRKFCGFRCHQRKQVNGFGTKLE